VMFFGFVYIGPTTRDDIVHLMVGTNLQKTTPSKRMISFSSSKMVNHSSMF